MAPKVLKNDGEIISVEMANVAVKVLAIFGTLIPMTANGLNVAIAFGIHSDIIFNSTYCPQNENEVFISMSIVASQYPEKLIFNFCVLTYAMMRPLYSFAYSFFYYHCSARQKHGVWYPRFCRGLAVESIIELFSSYFVMCVGIDEHFGLHVLGFIAYSFFNVLGMGTNVVLHKASGLYKIKPTTFYIKLFLWVTWFVIIFTFIASYPIYKYYCIPWAYPIFSVLEYVSLTWISIYNACIYHDLSDFKLQIVGTWPRINNQRKALLS